LQKQTYNLPLTGLLLLVLMIAGVRSINTSVISAVPFRKSLSHFIGSISKYV